MKEISGKGGSEDYHLGHSHQPHRAGAVCRHAIDGDTNKSDSSLGVSPAGSGAVPQRRRAPRGRAGKNPRVKRTSEIVEQAEEGPDGVTDGPALVSTTRARVTCGHTLPAQNRRRDRNN